MQPLIHQYLPAPETNRGTPAPAVVLIHGWKGNEHVMSIFRQAIPPAFAIVLPRAPFAVPDGGFGWIRERTTEPESPPTYAMAEGVQALQAFLQRVPTQYPIDPSRLMLVGFSQGAAVANGLVLSGGGTVAGVASIAGFTPRDTQTPPDLRLTGLRVWVAHGTRDEVVPIQAAHDTRAHYEALGATIQMAEYDTGHKLPIQGMRDLRTWLANEPPAES